MSDPLHAAFALAAAVESGDVEAMRSCVDAVEQSLGAGACRETLRQLHLYYGFPRMVQALNACAPLLGAAGPDESAEPAPDEPREAGAAVFRELYGSDADKVLPHLVQLDPTLSAWILEHAYARVLARPRFTLAAKERLAVACLAATRCWKQWESHHTIARRHGVSVDVLMQDLDAIRDWVGDEAYAFARRALSELAR